MSSPSASHLFLDASPSSFLSWRATQVSASWLKRGSLLFPLHFLHALSPQHRWQSSQQGPRDSCPLPRKACDGPCVTQE